MAWSDIPVYAPTNLIPSSWANQLFQNEVHLDNRSGHDAPAPNLFLVSGAAPSLVNGWRALQSGDFALGVIPDAAMANPKVTKAGDVMTGDLTVSRQSIGQPTVGYLWLGQTGSLVYIGYNGTNIVLQGARVYIPGILQTDSDLQAPGAIFGADGVQVNGAGGIAVLAGGGYNGGSKTAGAPSMLGLHLGATGIDSDGPATFRGNVNVAGNVTVGGSVGASGASLDTAVAAAVGLSVHHSNPTGVAIGVLNALGTAFDFIMDHSVATLSVSLRGVSAVFTGLVTAAGAMLNVNSASVSALQIQQANASGVSIGVLNPAGSAYDLLMTHGVASFGVPLQYSAASGAPITSASAALCTGVNADMTDGFHASATAGPSRIPVADAAGKLDAWISPSALAGVPSKLIAAVAVAADIPTGWGRYNAMNGRVPVGAGTTFGVTFAENGDDGSSWSHGHSSGGSHNHGSGGLFASGSTGDNSGTNSGQLNPATPGFVASPGPHSHSISNVPIGGNTANSGAATSSDRWNIPTHGLVYVIKS